MTKLFVNFFDCEYAVGIRSAVPNGFRSATLRGCAVDQPQTISVPLNRTQVADRLGPATGFPHLPSGRGNPCIPPLRRAPWRGRRDDRRATAAQVLRSRHVPVPRRRGPARGPSRGLHRHGLLARYQRAQGRNVLHPMGCASCGWCIKARLKPDRRQSRRSSRPMKRGWFRPTWQIGSAKKFAPGAGLWQDMVIVKTKFTNL